MKFENLATLILIFLASCTNGSKTQESKLVPDSVTQYMVSKEKQSYVTVKWTQLKDTTINDVTINFISLNKKEYDSLSNSTIETKIPLEGFGSLVTREKDCQLIKLNNGVIDSLCDKHEKSGYFQTYTIKGLWKEKGQLVVNFQNWEDSDDFLIDIRDGFIYNLNIEYQISPSKNFMLGYTSSNLIPLYGNNFMYTKIANDTIRTYFNIELGQLAITKLHWLADNKCLVSAGAIDPETSEPKNILYYLMKIKR